MNKEKLIFRLFIGKVSDIIGLAKTAELIEESKKDILYREKRRKNDLKKPKKT